MNFDASELGTRRSLSLAAIPVLKRVAFDRLGVFVALLAAGALLFEPFVTLRANRIASGKGVGFFDALVPATAHAGAFILVLVAASAIFRLQPWLRASGAGLSLTVLAYLVGEAPSHLISSEHPLARVAPAGGFWLLGFAFALLLTDAIGRLKLGPWPRLAMLAVTFALVAALLGSGEWNGLSVLKEYAVHSDSFWQEAAAHVELALVSLGAALIAGLPLGVACHGSRRLRELTLPALNIVQTIPSIAMYGLMMAPLALLAAHVPLAAEIGIRGIGTAPALIALFLYSLLPVVGNTVVGLASVSAQAVEAAEGMGMTRRQRLFGVELPLAAPVILTGVRIVLVQNIGLVTIAALIGGGGFGVFVFQGIGQAATDLVLLGAIPTIALAFSAAVILDAIVDLLKGRA